MKAPRYVLAGVIAFSWPLLAVAQEDDAEMEEVPVEAPTSGPGVQDSRESFGAFAAPAALPGGATAVYGFIGVPEVGGGYRQGVGLLEIDARLKFNYFALAFALEAFAKYPAYVDGPLMVAPSLGLGVVFNTGATYIDRHNFGYVGMRVTPGTSLSYRVAETASVVGELTVPIDIAFTRGGGNRVTPLIGGGGELYLGEDMTAGAVAQVGMDVIKEPLGAAQTRFAFALRVGIGYRFF